MKRVRVDAKEERKNNSDSGTTRALTDPGKPVATHGQLRVAKYDWKTKKAPTTPGYTNEIIHVFDRLSPYMLKDENRRIMENIWQFSKVYPQVTRQVHIEKYGGWKHEAEQHWDEKKKMILPAYWKWRAKGQNYRKAVRYPNGRDGRHTCMFVIPDESVDEIQRGQPGKTFKISEGRYHVYYKTYTKLARQHPYYSELLARLRAGENIQIAEVDGPPLGEISAPFHRVVNGSIEVNKTVIQEWIHSRFSFGHGICLAAALLGDLTAPDTAESWIEETLSLGGEKKTESKEEKKERKEGKEEKQETTRKPVKTVEREYKRSDKEEGEEEVRFLAEYLPDPDHHIVRECWSWNLTYDEENDAREEIESENVSIEDGYRNSKTDNEHVEEMVEWIRESAARGRRTMESIKRRLGWRLNVTLSNVRRQHMRQSWVFVGLSDSDYTQLLRLVSDNIPICYRIG